MENKQAEKIREAAEKFAEAVQGSFQTSASRSAEAQERGSQLAQNFFESVIKQLQSEAESNQAAAQGLTEHSRRQQEAVQQLSQESVGVYKNFLDSMTAFYRTQAEQAKRSER